MTCNFPNCQFKITVTFHWISREVQTRILPINLQRKSPHGSSDEYLKRVTPGMDTMMDHQGKTHLAALLLWLKLNDHSSIGYHLPDLVEPHGWHHHGVAMGLAGSPRDWQGPHGVGRVTTWLAESPQGHYGVGRVVGSRQDLAVCRVLAVSHLTKADCSQSSDVLADGAVLGRLS